MIRKSAKRFSEKIMLDKTGSGIAISAQNHPLRGGIARPTFAKLRRTCYIRLIPDP